MTGPVGSWPWLGRFWSILVIAGLSPTMGLLGAHTRPCLGLTMVLQLHYGSGSPRLSLTDFRMTWLDLAGSGPALVGP